MLNLKLSHFRLYHDFLQILWKAAYPSEKLWFTKFQFKLLSFKLVKRPTFVQVWSKVDTTSILAGDTVKAHKASVAVLLRGKVYMTEGDAQEDQDQVIDQQR